MDRDLWVFDGGTIRFLTFPYRIRMTVARLRDGSLLVHSPIRLTEELAREVDARGVIRHLVSPNKLHHLHLAEWAYAYPDASVWAPPGLAEKRDDLRFDGELRDRPERAWGRDLDQTVVRGSWFMSEVVFFHRDSGTLLLGDLIENHEPADFSRAQRLVARANGMFGQTPVNYRVTFSDRAKAREAIDKILSWKPDRVVPMHGPIIEQDVEARLRRAFAWAL